MIQYYPIMILYAVALHFTWAIAGLLDTSAYNATALAPLFRLFGNLSPLILISVGVSALLGLEVKQSLTSFALMLPQQTVLVISAIGSLHAMIVGHFADGIERSSAFIVADQIPSVLVALGHTAAIFQFVLREMIK